RHGRRRRRLARLTGRRSEGRRSDAGDVGEGDPVGSLGMGIQRRLTDSAPGHLDLHAQGFAGDAGAGDHPQQAPEGVPFGVVLQVGAPHGEEDAVRVQDANGPGIAVHAGAIMAFPDGRPCHTPSMRRSATASVGFVVWVLMAGVASGQLPPGGTFWDDDGNVHEGAVEAVAAAGITRACGEADLYCPDRILTRAEMAAFLVRALDLPPSQRDHFSDDSDSVFEAEIDALAAAGITRGCRRGEFCPTEPVTRA